jgi:hypothetical protein
MARVNFRVNYQVLQRRKFERYLAKYEKNLGEPLNDLLIERYRKIPEQFQASFWVELRAGSVKSAVYQMLIWANGLTSRGWSIIGPHADNNLAFECIYSDNESDKPLKWAHLEYEDE